MSKNRLVVNCIFWPIVLVFLFVAFGPDLRFGPDFRLSTKAIHPDAPGFQAGQFRFEDYNDYRDVMFVLGRMFPPGTTKSEIQNTLDQQTKPPAVSERKLEGQHGGGYQLQYEFKKIYLQRCFLGVGGHQDRLIFVFDHDNRLLSFHLRNGCGVLPAYEGTRP